MVVLYLVFVVCANLLVAHFGPSVAVFTAFLFVGMDISARDYLHEKWHGKHLFLKMFVLIAAGSLLSWVVNRNAGSIAVASFLAFACAGLTDFLVYHRLFATPFLVKVNGSNVVSAVVDSLVFVSVAFGFPILVGVVLGQILAKIGGGFMWSLVLSRWK